MVKRYSINSQINKLPPQLKNIIFLCRDIANPERIAFPIPFKEGANQEKIDVYLVGGFVRDLLLGVDNFDLDIVVERDGIDFAYQLSKILGAELIKHKAFGTATLTLRDGLKIDIATSRKEFYPEPAALPIVSQGSIQDDLLRRDFTINAIACHIDYEKFGQVIDVCGGLKDLNKRKIRFLHNRSFIDDPTRIIRAARFEQRFKFNIEENTLSFIKEAKKLKMLEKVHKHRIRDEIILIFKESNSYGALNRLKQIYNLTFIHKDIKLNKKLEKSFFGIKKACDWFKNAFPRRRKLDVWLMYLIIFLYSIDLKALRTFLKKYAFHRGDAKRIISFSKDFVKIDKKISTKNLSAVRLNDVISPLSYEVIILAFAISKNKLTKQRIKEFLVKHHHKKISITGKDLLALGVKSGPEFKKILRKVFMARLNGEVCGRQEELEFVRKIIRL